MFPIQQPDIEFPSWQVCPTISLHHVQLFTGEQLTVVSAVDDTAKHILKVGDIVRHVARILPFAGGERVMLGQGGWGGKCWKRR